MSWKPREFQGRNYQDQMQNIRQGDDQLKMATGFGDPEVTDDLSKLSLHEL